MTANGLNYYERMRWEAYVRANLKNGFATREDGKLIKLADLDTETRIQIERNGGWIRRG